MPKYIVYIEEKIQHAVTVDIPYGAYLEEIGFKDGKPYPITPELGELIQWTEPKKGNNNSIKRLHTFVWDEKYTGWDIDSHAYDEDPESYIDVIKE